MDIRTIKYFVALAEHENFTKASQSLKIAQPSLSYAIKKLEQDTGTQLFEREKKRVILTEIGQQFFIFAKEFLNHHQSLEKNLEYLGEYGTGAISIGMIESVKNWLPQIIDKHHQKYKDQKFELYEIITLKEMNNALKTSSLHLCISNHKMEDDLINCELLYEEEFILAAREEIFGKRKAVVSLKELKNIPLIITPNKFLTHQDILTVFETAGITPLIKYEVERFDTACSLVESGLGVTFLPKSYVTIPGSNTFQQMEISDFTPKRKVYLLYNKNRVSINSVSHFISLCRSFSKK
ncbi:LysR family transcriptional regulator [Corticicoccus populi]|uniref:LysR family transcriptional regulator n=1 Tax=Corticicoccus populi TaxID=1812821 RepID=A0ABW5X0R6_9STAP